MGNGGLDIHLTQHCPICSHSFAAAATVIHLSSDAREEEKVQRSVPPGSYQEDNAE